MIMVEASNSSWKKNDFEIASFFLRGNVDGANYYGLVRLWCEDIANSLLLKTFFFRRTGRGGGHGFRSKLKPIARWLQRRVLWMSGMAYEKLLEYEAKNQVEAEEEPEEQEEEQEEQYREDDDMADLWGHNLSVMI